MGRYFVRTVDNALLPEGKDWMLIDVGDDVTFVVGRNDRPVEIPPCVLDALRMKVQAAFQRQAS
jgi:hypothetical protein